MNAFFCWWVIFQYMTWTVSLLFSVILSQHFLQHVGPHGFPFLGVGLCWSGFSSALFGTVSLCCSSLNTDTSPASSGTSSGLTSASGDANVSSKVWLAGGAFSEGLCAATKEETQNHCYYYIFNLINIYGILCRIFSWAVIPLSHSVCLSAETLFFLLFVFRMFMGV